MKQSAIGFAILFLVCSSLNASDKQLSICRNYLMIIEGAKDQWALENRKGTGDLPSQSDLRPFLRVSPACPAGGVYQIGEVGSLATCSLHGTWESIGQQLSTSSRPAISLSGWDLHDDLWGWVFWAVLFSFWFTCACYTSKLANEKGYNAAWWFLGGFLFGLIALIASAGLPDKLARPGHNPFKPGS